MDDEWMKTCVEQERSVWTVRAHQRMDKITIRQTSWNIEEK